jgi:A/G-specific adenine glycosylase
VVVPAALSRLQAALLEWAQANGRHDLPWRHTRDPWAVLVSEVMLQRTQVVRVIPAYRRFLDRFPTPAACAAAPAAEVVRAWAGLGYNRRAVNLHRAAAAVVERHGGHLPDDLASLTALPGIGTYTARAVLVFAFERDVGVVETNTARVLARAAAGRPLSAADAQACADAAVPPGRGWAWNSAVLDLGATVCTRRGPRCDECPAAAARSCSWRGSGRSVSDPATSAPTQSTFAGSDRQGRGRLVAALRAGPLPVARAPAAAGWPADTARTGRVVAGLVADGLAVVDDGWLRLP